MKKILFILSLTVLLFNACEKPEPLRELPPVPVGTQIKVFGMGENYENQIFFEFSTQEMVLNRHDLWDVAFACDGSHKILVNGGKNGSFGVARFPGQDFNSFTTLDVKNTNWQFDNPSGQDDSLVFNDWCYKAGTVYMGKGDLYVFDLGDDTLGVKRYVKFKVLQRDGGVYSFQWSYLSDTTPAVEEFKKSTEDRNYIYYNFALQKEAYNEPLEKNRWDIVFTTYKKWIPDEFGKPYPYVLRGVLSNPYKVTVAEVTGLVNYEEIDLAYAKTAMFSANLDELGYDWKIWSLTANKYTVDPNKIYVIKDTKGDYYKLKFVDFYDDKGRKGYPKMAWEALK